MGYKNLIGLSWTKMQAFSYESYYVQTHLQGETSTLYVRDQFTAPYKLVYYQTPPPALNPTHPYIPNVDQYVHITFDPADIYIESLLLCYIREVT